MGWVIAPQASAAFVANMERVLDVYRRPHDPAHPVVCMDETPRQLIGQTRQSIAAQPGKPEREDHEYQRLGVCNVFMACEPLAGSRLTKVTERRTKTDWSHFVEDIANSYPQAQRITLVMDNLNTHTPASLYEAFAPDKAKAPKKRRPNAHPAAHLEAQQIAQLTRERDELRIELDRAQLVIEVPKSYRTAGLAGSRQQAREHLMAATQEVRRTPTACSDLAGRFFPTPFASDAVLGLRLNLQPLVGNGTAAFPTFTVAAVGHRLERTVDAREIVCIQVGQRLVHLAGHVALHHAAFVGSRWREIFPVL